MPPLSNPQTGPRPERSRAKPAARPDSQTVNSVPPRVWLWSAHAFAQHKFLQLFPVEHLPEQPFLFGSGEAVAVAPETVRDGAREFFFSGNFQLQLAVMGPVFQRVVQRDRRS